MPPKRHWKPKLRTTDDAALTADFDDITSGQAINAIQAGSSVLTFDSVSQDQRRLHRESVPLPATFAFNGTPSTSTPSGSNTPLPDSAPLPNIDWEVFFENEDGGHTPADPDNANTSDNEHAPRYQSSVSTSVTWNTCSHLTGFLKDQPISSWLEDRDYYLNELNRREGRGDFRNERCYKCGDAETAREATIRCMSCIPGPLRCEACIVRDHADHPYHRLKVSTPS